MDVTPQLLKEVEFREKFRGYDPDEVDDFLERVGTAFAQLHDRLRVAESQIESANSRAARAEASARDNSDTDDTLRRTLVLAQRTADAAIKEAEENAAAIVAEAQIRARQQVAGAQEQADQIKAAADGELESRQAEAAAQSQATLSQAGVEAASTLSSAREQANELLMEARNKSEAFIAEARSNADVANEARRAHLAAELAELEARRASLVTNAELLDTHVSQHRSRIATLIAQLQQSLEDPESLAEIAPPVLVDEPTLTERATPTEPVLPSLDLAVSIGIAEPAHEAAPEADATRAEPATQLSEESGEDAPDDFELAQVTTEFDPEGNWADAVAGSSEEFASEGFASDEHTIDTQRVESAEGSDSYGASAADDRAPFFEAVPSAPPPPVGGDDADESAAVKVSPLAAFVSSPESTAQVDMAELIADRAPGAVSEGRVPPPPPPPPRSLSGRVGLQSAVPPPVVPSASPPWASIGRQSPPLASPPSDSGNSFFDELRKATGEGGENDGEGTPDDSVETALSFFDRDKD